MGRRRRAPEKQTINVWVEGRSIPVTLHPPTGGRSSWYAYWSGLASSRSTGHADYEEAVRAVGDLLGNGGRRSELGDTLLSDEEFEEIQRRHFAKKSDPAARARSLKSLRECLDAISAFRAISELTPITLATPEDCERFQQTAIALPRDWRVRYADTPRSREHRERRGAVACLSPSTVHKWSVTLRASFNRANHNAGSKCVRSVVPTAKLLTENPWNQFTWIEGRKRPLRQFAPGELLSLLDYFAERWPGISFAPAFAKLSLWSGSRRREVSGLRWEQLRSVDDESHFESTGKHGVTKWFRVPQGLFEDLQRLRTSSPFVFGCYGEELRRFHEDHGNTAALRQVRSAFDMENVGDWMYRQVSAWSSSLPGGSAYLHVFRKTSLQCAFSGEHLERTVARDASVTRSVMMASYASARDEDLRLRSNATYRRLVQSLPVEVAVRYGHADSPTERLREQLDAARTRADWPRVVELAGELQALATGAAV